MSKKHSTPLRILPLVVIGLLCHLACAGDSGSSGRGGRTTPGGSDDAKVDGSTSATNLSAGTLSREDLEKMPMEELSATEGRRRNQDANDKDNLERLVVINFELCKTLSKIRHDCPVLKRVIPESTDQNLTCKQSDASASTANTNATTITVTLPADKQGKFKLIANDLYESNEFAGSSTPTPITFSAKGAANVEAPRFIDIFKLVIRSSTEGTALPPLAGFNPIITIDGRAFQTLAQKSDDAKRASDKTEYKLDNQKMLDELHSTDCNMTEKKFNALVVSAEAPIKNKQVGSRTSDYFKNRRDSPPAKIADTPANRNTLIEKIMTLERSISERSPILEAELSKKMTLRSSLLTDSKRGCQFNKRIEKLTITLGGSLRNDYIGMQSSRQPADQGRGSAYNLLVDLGSGINFVLNLKDDNALGSVAAYTNLNPNDVIGGIDRVILRKQGVYYSDRRECTSKLPGQDLNFDLERCEYAITEEYVMNINEIKIEANDEVIYHARNLEVTLNRDKREYAVDHFHSNAQWLTLMQKTTCDDVQ